MYTARQSGASDRIITITISAMKSMDKLANVSKVAVDVAGQGENRHYHLLTSTAIVKKRLH